jgi:hypothetical protein
MLRPLSQEELVGAKRLRDLAETFIDPDATITAAGEGE